MVTYLQARTYLEQLEDERDAAMAEADRLRQALADHVAWMGRRAARPPAPPAPPVRVSDLVCARCAGPVEPVVRLGPTTLDTGRRLLTRGDRTVHLTPRECQLLAALARTPGRAVPYPIIYEMVWGRKPTSGVHAINIHLCRLRRKLGHLVRLEVTRDHGVALLVGDGNGHGA